VHNVFFLNIKRLIICLPSVKTSMAAMCLDIPSHAHGSWAICCLFFRSYGKFGPVELPDLGHQTSNLLWAILFPVSCRVLVTKLTKQANTITSSKKKANGHPSDHGRLLFARGPIACTPGPGHELVHLVRRNTLPATNSRRAHRTATPTPLPRALRRHAEPAVALVR
jgi:hypothetical protein